MYVCKTLFEEPTRCSLKLFLFRIFHEDEKELNVTKFCDGKGNVGKI